MMKRNQTTSEQVKKNRSSSTTNDDPSSLPKRNLRRRERCISVKKAFLSFHVILLLGYLSHFALQANVGTDDLSAEILQLGNNDAPIRGDTITLDSEETDPVRGVEGPEKCTLEQLMKVRTQLDPKHCAATIDRPFYQKCSLTAATKCPDTSNYLDEYYDEIQKQYLKSSNRKNDFDPFVGLSVGCNKGFDALNTLRMGTFDASLSKEAWRKEMLKDGVLWKSVCAQDSTSIFSVDAAIVEPREGVVHCFEPMPATVTKLQESSRNLGYDKKGYKVVHAAVDDKIGKVYFPATATSGVENHGIGNCVGQALKDKIGDCTAEVEVLTLKKYVKENIPGDGPIHILQVDVEGYDNNVLLGAEKDVLERVEYLEFEYNWMGPWKDQHLYDTIEMLDELDFTCYWTGRQMLWRITGCWQLYFDIHAWSNISCANRRRVPVLANKMEGVFQQTLKSNRNYRGRVLNYETLPPNQEAMSTDPEIMTQKYLNLS